MNFKSVLKIFLQGLGAMLAFLIGLIAANIVFPLSPEIMQAGGRASGFLSAPMAMLFNAAVNALILVWAARRSSFTGWRLIGQLLVLSFGVQVFQTQIETGYFLSAFPLLNGNFQLYVLVARGLVTSLIFVLLTAWMCGGFSRGERPPSAFTVACEMAVRQGAWLAAVYFILYLLFGYYVAWQFQELRLFYGGPAELNGFIGQWLGTLMTRPEMPFFQYARGVVWLLCLLPLFKGFTGGRIELTALSALALALLPTAQLSFPNPLMPAGVSYGHFWEVLISTGIYGALCAWFVPQEVRAK
jgi:hypothetical protein